ncbi:nucleoside deaminase [Zobellella iuensis]|uniref:Nucleoside deaminase n=1 Tax=Zobellella iuensis TaxID=2803811 RepID=A0ABS1QRI4_9GAMM|nr:nucleoside deaminase [Zobellella iuensis]MBL1377147.1 nucleoside deaminase [Zobellella iuensis]
MNRMEQLARLNAETADDGPALGLLAEALAAGARGDYPVAAWLMDASGRVWASGQNRVFSDGFCSAAHAEMQALDTFERLSVRPAATGLSLWVSLEPCPMCLARALYAGVGEIVYLVEDEAGGMVHRRDQLPPALLELVRRVRCRPARLGWAVARFAGELARASRAELRAALLAAREGDGP